MFMLKIGVKYFKIQDTSMKCWKTFLVISHTYFSDSKIRNNIVVMTPYLVRLADDGTFDIAEFLKPYSDTVGDNFILLTKTNLL